MGKQVWQPLCTWGQRFGLGLGRELGLTGGCFWSWGRSLSSHSPGGLGGALNWVHSARHSWCGLRGGGAAVAPDTFASECDDKLPFPISADPSASKTVGPNEHTAQQL